MFHYLGHERLQMAFFSPNICGAFLTILVLIICGIFLYFSKSEKHSLKIFSYCLLPVIICLFIGIGMTYSRGSYIACLFALISGHILVRSIKSVMFIFIFLAIILSVPDGGQRVVSTVHFREGSIYNRFYLWRGGCAAIAENWTTGVGPAPAPGQYYCSNYRPAWIKAEYLTFVNDPLTIGASYGIFALFLWLLLTGIPLHAGFIVFRHTANPLLAYLLCSASSYLIAGLFSTLFRFFDLIWLFILATTLILWFVLYDIKKSPGEWHCNISWLFVPASAGVICLAILIIGNLVCFNIL